MKITIAAVCRVIFTVPKNTDADVHLSPVPGEGYNFIIDAGFDAV